MVSRGAVVMAARKYLGVPFVHAGRNMNGIDCVGLLIKTGQDVGMFEWDDVDYGPAVDPDRLVREVEMFCSPVDGPIGKADVLLFNILGYPQHVGIVTEAGSVDCPASFIHAYQTVGKVVEHELDCSWLDRIARRYFWDESKWLV